MSEEKNTWGEYSNLVLKELERLNDNYDKMRTDMDTRFNELKDEYEINYNRVIREFNKKIKQSVYNLLDEDMSTEFIKDRTIVDLDIRESGIKFGKRSFTNCELTLSLKNEIPVNSELMRPMLDDITKMLLDDVFNNNKSFKFHRKKN